MFNPDALLFCSEPGVGHAGVVEACAPGCRILQPLEEINAITVAWPFWTNHPPPGRYSVLALPADDGRVQAEFSIGAMRDSHPIVCGIVRQARS